MIDINAVRGRLTIIIDKALAEIDRFAREVQDRAFISRSTVQAETAALLAITRRLVTDARDPEWAQRRELEEVKQELREIAALRASADAERSP
jgi:hypothetical protein